MSSLVRNVGTIGALTAVSRVFGFVRDMLLSRVLGAGLAADAWQLAFTLPNTFRRLFAEGAFSVAFVPMYSRALHADGGEEAADRFAGDVLSVFVCFLLTMVGYSVFTDFLAGYLHLPVPVVDVIANFGFTTHFEAFMKGVIDPKDVVFFLSLMGFTLFLNVVALER